MHRHKLSFIVSLCAIFVLLSACGNQKNEEYPSIRSSTSAKFEYAGEPGGGYKFITSEIASLYTFDSLRLISSDNDFSGEWIYRITFDPGDIVKGGNEIVVAFAENSVQVNGQNYVAEDGVDFDKILEWAANKYTSFEYELQYTPVPENSSKPE